MRKELSQHNHRFSSTGRDRSKKSQAPNSDQVAQNFGQSEILQRQILQPMSPRSTVLLGLPNIQMEPSLLPFIPTAFFSLSQCSPVLISQQSSPRLWKAALGTLSLLMSRVASSALPACPQRPHAMRCAGSLHSLCSAVHWHMTAWSLSSPSSCPSSSRDSSLLRNCHG